MKFLFLSFLLLHGLASIDSLFEATKGRDRSCGNHCDSTSAAAASLQSNKVKPFSHGQQNDLERDLTLSEEAVKILASCLSEQEILDAKTKITFYHLTNEVLNGYFSNETTSTSCFARKQKFL